MLSYFCNFKIRLKFKHKLNIIVYSIIFYLINRMGVPRVFKWIVQKYPASFKKDGKPVDSFSYLCLDINGLLHPCVRESILEKGRFDMTTLEKKIREKISYLVEITNPSKGILICIDGVAPLAKMYQQRYRRYKSVKDKELEKSIYAKNGLEYLLTWDTNAITPSTEFMKSMNELFFKISKELEEKNPSCQVIYSDSDSVGEGEHKIMEILRKLPKNKEDTYVIHGLDADLIFLSIGLERDNIHLLREMKDTIGYLNITELKNKLFLEIQSLSRTALKQSSVEKDFMVLSYFLGNDFLPTVFSLDINDLDIVIKTYTSVVETEKKYLVYNGLIDWNILGKICEKLSEFEYNLLKKKTRKYLDCSVSDSNIEDPIQKEIFWAKQKPREDSLGLLEGGWKERYYRHYFHFEHTNWSQKNTMMINYLEGLQWNLNYYLKGVQNWLWNYRYHSSPFFSDMYHFILKKGIRDLIKASKEVCIPSRPPTNIEQLLVVLPIQSSNLIPMPYRDLMTNISISSIIDLYPIDYKLDYYYKQNDWEHKPILPDIDFQRIIDQVLLLNKINQL